MNPYRRHLEDYSNNMDFILNPNTNQPIEKYGPTWFYLLRKGYNENDLEKLPIVNKDFIINPKTKQPIEKYGKTWQELIKQGYSERKLHTLPMVNKMNEVTHVNKLDLFKNKPQRGGVILYTIINGQLFFGLGLDSTYNELTDFSGGISYKRDRNAIEGSLREFCEESEGLYCTLTMDDVINSPVIVDKHNLIMFLYTNEHPDDITYQFQLQGKCSEIKNIVWITEDELKLAIRFSLTYIYARLRNFLKKFGDFYQYLKN